MKLPIKDKVINYLVTVLGIEAAFFPYAEAANLPHHLTETYAIEEIRILGERFLALFARENELTPASVETQANWLLQRTGFRCILVAETLAAHNRRRLIERKMPFVVPGNQLYLPDLGLDLRAHIRKARTKVSKVSPASQVVVLAYLLRRLHLPREFTAASLAQALGYTKMTMFRALDELCDLRLVERPAEGRPARFQFMLAGRQLWDEARPRLRSPVKKRIYLNGGFAGSEFRAGDSALEEVTMLGKPSRATWAVTSEQWKQLRKEPGTDVIPHVSKNMAHTEIEIWYYDPRLLADPPCVDPLSLALSLSDESGERVQIAVDQLLRKMPW